MECQVTNILSLKLECYLNFTGSNPIQIHALRNPGNQARQSSDSWSLNHSLEKLRIIMTIKSPKRIFVAIGSVQTLSLHRWRNSDIDKGNKAHQALQFWPFFSAPSFKMFILVNICPHQKTKPPSSMKFSLSIAFDMCPNWITYLTKNWTGGLCTYHV